MLDKLAAIEDRYRELETLLADPELSTDYARVRKLAQEHASLRGLASLARRYRDVIREQEEAAAISREGSDRELAELAREELAELEQERARIEQELRVELLPKDPNDERNVIMEIRAGTGGEEAGLFAADLFRMYTRYVQRHGWKIDVVSANETGLGSLKETVFQIHGRDAYSRMKHEIGVHRVQRIPTTESSGRIHTSAATVAVLPEADEVDVNIRADDLQIDIFHASGHGGQNVQKVATAIRITHKPTGIVAVCQDERSQNKNKEKAMKVLRARVLALELARQQEEVSQARRAQVGSGDRSERVRTYNFPQDRVTDHRTSYTRHNLDAVLDGEIDDLIESMIAREQEMEAGGGRLLMLREVLGRRPGPSGRRGNSRRQPRSRGAAAHGARRGPHRLPRLTGAKPSRTTGYRPRKSSWPVDSAASLWPTSSAPGSSTAWTSRSARRC